MEHVQYLQRFVGNSLTSSYSLWHSTMIADQSATDVDCQPIISMRSVMLLATAQHTVLRIKIADMVKGKSVNCGTSTSVCLIVYPNVILIGIPRSNKVKPYIYIYIHTHTHTHTHIYIYRILYELNNE